MAELKEYRIMKEAIAPYDVGVNKGKHYYPGSPHGDIVELADDDPRVKDWLAAGFIAVPDKAHEAEMAKLEAELEKVKAEAEAMKKEMAEKVEAEKKRQEGRKKPGPKPKDAKEGD